ncbi:MAG: hypothetical protein AAF934_05890 [Bacteroidota bacterium]
MKIEELVNRLDEIGVSKNSYSLTEGIEEKFYLIENNFFFEFYFLKQGAKRMYKFFESEEQACKFFYEFIIENKNKDKYWVYKNTIQENEKFKINGINIWDTEWRSTNKYISVEDPLYNQPFLFEIYELKTKKEKIIFAAGEFSNGIWGIYQKV